MDRGYNPSCSTDQADPFTTKLASSKIGAGHKVTPPHNQTGSSASKGLENDTLDHGFDPLSAVDHGCNPLCSTDQADPFTFGKIGAGHKLTPPHNRTGSSASKVLENETLDQVDPVTPNDDEDGLRRPRLGEGIVGRGPATMVVSFGKPRTFHEGAGMCYTGRWPPGKQNLVSDPKGAEVGKTLKKLSFDSIRGLEPTEFLALLACAEIKESPFSKEKFIKGRLDLRCWSLAAHDEYVTVGIDSGQPFTLWLLSAVLKQVGDPDWNEQAEGFMQEVPYAMAKKEFGSDLLLVALAGIEKSDDFIRVIHDDTHGVKADQRIRPRDQGHFPGIADKQFFMQGTRDEKISLSGNKAEVSKAHRRVKVRRVDIGLQACQLHRKSDWLKLVGAFGIGGSSYRWTRFASCIFAHDWIGYWHDYKSFEVGVSEARAKWLCNWIDETLAQGGFLARSMAEVLGRLGFAAVAMDYFRPFLAPSHGWCSSVPMGALLDAPVILKILLKFFQSELECGDFLSKCVSQASSGTTPDSFRADAMSEDGKAAMGGWCYADDPDPMKCRCFFFEIKREDAPGAFVHGKDQLFPVHCDL